MIYVIKKETRTVRNDLTVNTRQRLLGYTNSWQTAEEMVKKLDQGKYDHKYGSVSYSVIQLNEIEEFK